MEDGNGHIPSQLTLATAKLIELLASGKPGDKLTDEEMTAHCERDTRPSVKGKPGAGYNNLCSAIRNVLRTKGLVWERIRGADAIECKKFPGKLSIAARNQRMINKRAKRSLAVLGTVKQAEVPDTERVQFNVKVAQLGVLAAMSSGNTTKKLEAREVTTIDPKKLLDSIVSP